MGFPLFRFTLNNATEGSLEISEPGGWDEAILKLERDKEYHSLVEFYEQPLLFYGEDTSHNAGIAYIRNIEQTQGPEAIIEITIEISEDEGNTYETLFDGVLDLSTTRETDFYKLECGVLRKDFWAKFFNRKDIPVDLQSTTDLDGVTVSLVDKIVLPLPSQKIRVRFERLTDWADNVTRTLDETAVISYPVSGLTKLYILFSNANVLTDEVEERQEYGSQFSDLKPTDALKYQFIAKYSGSYTINASLRYFFSLSASRTYDVKWYRAIRSNGTLIETQIGSTQSGSDATIMDDGARVLSLTTNLNAGDEFYLWGELDLSSAVATASYFPDYDSDLGAPYDPVYTEFEIEADTVFQQTETDAYLIKDAAESILSKYIGSNNVVLSDYLEVGSPRGCGSLYAIMKGLHVRGYSFADKPFFLSFNQWWDGINPILNLGLGYEGENIRIEQKSYFYDSTPVLNLDFVNNIERRYDLEKIYKSIQIGYNKWSAESASGVDDPQTKRTWRTNFATIGQDVKFLSEFVAASLAIEQTRRNRVELGKDWRLDEDVLIIAVNDGSPEYVPELDENFDSITGLLNSDTRYNIRLSCAHNFERWKNVFNGCMQWQNGDFVFSAGEGNFDMTSTLDGADCEANSPESAISEKGNIESTNDFLFIPVIYEFEHPLTFTEYKTMRDNRTKAIGVSRTDSGHVACHILNVDYQITHGKANFTVILAENAYL